MTRVAAIVLLAALPVGCVNDYVVGDDETAGNATDGTGGVGDTGSGTAQGDTSKGTDVGDSTGGTGQADPTATGGDTSASTFTCEPCTADNECGDEYDNCVDLGDVGPRCLISCPEAGCGPGMDCMDATSVDGFVVPQCVPLSPACP